MCKINCSGGCPGCAPDEHAAESARLTLCLLGYDLNDDGFYAVAAIIAKNMQKKKASSVE
jgi:hypothetical protein